MKKKTHGTLFAAISLLLSFILWTVLISVVDVKAIGPCGSAVGFATLNGYVHGLTGTNLFLYNLTDCLSLIPIGIMAGFALFGLINLIKVKNLLKVEYDILILGVFYAVVMAAYLLFEEVVINYRPILINGLLEASYPSSTTMLVGCVMPTAIIQLSARIKNRVARKTAISLLFIFTVFMILARLVSGVHWFTDIIGGALLSSALVMLYRYFLKLNKN